MKQRNGFTLIELLVVVAIIAVLVAILLPAIGKAKEIGMQMSCAGRMKQVGLGMHMYFGDYQDTFPPYKYADSVGMLYWADLLKPYVNDKNPNWGADSSPCGDVFFCPKMGPGFIWNGRNCSTKYMGFAYNNYALGGDMWKKPTEICGKTMRLSKIQSPDKILCLAEAFQLAIWVPGNPLWSVNQVDDGGRIHYRHRMTSTQDIPGDGYCNVLYTDGHISPAAQGEIKYGWDNFYLKYPYMEEGW